MFSYEDRIEQKSEKNSVSRSSERIYIQQMSSSVCICLYVVAKWLNGALSKVQRTQLYSYSWDGL